MDKYYQLAKKLHATNIVTDAHLDLGGIIYNRHKLGETNVLKKHFLDSFKAGGFRLIVAVIFVETEYTDMALKMALRQINVLKQEIALNVGDCILIRDRADLEALAVSDKIGFLISLEGAEPIGREIDLLDTFYELGVRGLGLTWSRRNYVADGSYFGDPEEGRRGGLTPFGIEVVRKAVDLGIWLDISHLNDEGVYDVIKYTSKPLMASHSNMRTVNSMMRNLPDDIIDYLIKNNGFIGVNAYRKIVSCDPAKQTIATIADHIEYSLNRGGANCVGFGFDLCRMFYDPNDEIDVLHDHVEALAITAELLRRGHSEAELVKIIGQNFIDYLMKVL